MPFMCGKVRDVTICFPGRPCLGSCQGAGPTAVHRMGGGKAEIQDK